MKSPQYRGRTASRQERETAILLRESIRFRISALQFHLQQIPPMAEHHRQTLAARGPDLDTQVIFSASWQQQYVFDDLVFHAISAFDYIANAVWLGFHGTNHWRRKWNLLVRAARDADVEANLAGASRINGTPTGREILSAHTSLVDRLYAYRSDLIHVAIDSTSGRANARFARDDVEYALHIRAPKTFHRKFAGILSLPEAEECSLGVAAEALVQGVMVRASSILKALIADVDPEDQPLTLTP